MGTIAETCIDLLTTDSDKRFDSIPDEHADVHKRDAEMLSKARDELLAAIGRRRDQSHARFCRDDVRDPFAQERAVVGREHADTR